MENKKKHSRLPMQVILFFFLGGGDKWVEVGPRSLFGCYLGCRSLRLKKKLTRDLAKYKLAKNEFRKHPSI